MKMQLLSDLHNESRIRPISVPDVGADLVVLAGDIDSGPNLVRRILRLCEAVPDPVQIVYVIGNHEFYFKEYHQTLQTLRQSFTGTRIHLLSNDAVVINSVRVLGSTLWTDYACCSEISPEIAMETAEARIVDHRRISIQEGPRRRTFLPHHARELHIRAVRWLQETLSEPFPGPTVVATHHGPAPLAQHKDFPLGPLSGAFWSDLTGLMPGVDLWMYGHTHDNVDAQIGTTRLVTNQAGYEWDPVPDFDPERVITL